MTQDFCHAKCAFIGNNLELTEQMKKTLGQGYQSIESHVNEKRKQGELSLGEIVALDLTEIPGRYLLLVVKQDALCSGRKSIEVKNIKADRTFLEKNDLVIVPIHHKDELWLADRPETITKIRVWIASMALNAPKVVGNTDNKQGLAIPIELALVKRSEIVEELPDQCPGENVFQRLARNLATSKMPTASHCHEKLEAMDPAPKNASSKTDNILMSSSTKQTGPSCQAGPSDEDEFTSIIDHLVEDQLREENYPDNPLDFSEGTSAGDDTSVDFGQLTKQFARERSDSDDTDEELTDDDELAQSFQKNKIPVLKRIGNARKDFAAGTFRKIGGNIDPKTNVSSTRK
eukprot:Seg6690.2 transcript_id=Seg6690.2/GoldUCD/mRNA.D3Y31 product="hypothetical protein" protein_id=Seg6690.2/GoldUCD/D3Y31